MSALFLGKFFLGYPGPSEAILEPSWGQIALSRTHLGTILEPSWVLWALLGAISGLFWSHFGRFWRHLGVLLGHFDAFLACQPRSRKRFQKGPKKFDGFQKFLTPFLNKIQVIFPICFWTILWTGFGRLLEQIWRSVSAKHWLKQLNLFLRGSWRLPGSVLKAFQAVLELFGEAGCSRNAVKLESKFKFSETHLFDIFPLLDHFRESAKLILGGCRPQNGGYNSLKLAPKS